jgi:hypothetical protein
VDDVGRPAGHQRVVGVREPAAGLDDVARDGVQLGAQVREQRGPRDGRLGSQDAVDARGPQGLGAQRVEQGLFEELVDAVGRVDAVLWPDEHLDGRELGHAAQELLDEDRADVARPSRDEDGGSGEGVADGGLGRWFIGWFGRKGGEGKAHKEERKRGGLFVLFCFVSFCRGRKRAKRSSRQQEPRKSWGLRQLLPLLLPPLLLPPLLLPPLLLMLRLLSCGGGGGSRKERCSRRFSLR